MKYTRLIAARWRSLVAALRPAEPEPTRKAAPPAQPREAAPRDVAPPARVVALLVPARGEPTFRLRATPNADDLPDGSGRIYRTPDGRIELDWDRRAS